MGDVFDSLAGLGGSLLMVEAYRLSPTLALMGIGWFMGVVAMRMTRGYFKRDG
jgi:hypothetical protein